MSCTLISITFDLLQKGVMNLKDDQIRIQSGHVSIEMRLKGLLKCTVVCCVLTEETKVVQLCILMPLSSQIIAVEERLGKSTILLAKHCHFLHAAVISVLELTTLMTTDRSLFNNLHTSSLFLCPYKYRLRVH